MKSDIYTEPRIDPTGSLFGSGQLPRPTRVTRPLPGAPMSDIRFRRGVGGKTKETYLRSVQMSNSNYSTSLNKTMCIIFTRRTVVEISDPAVAGTRQIPRLPRLPAAYDHLVSSSRHDGPRRRASDDIRTSNYWRKQHYSWNDSGRRVGRWGNRWMPQIK